MGNEKAKAFIAEDIKECTFSQKAPPPPTLSERVRPKERCASPLTLHHVLREAGHSAEARLQRHFAAAILKEAPLALLWLTGERCVCCCA